MESVVVGWTVHEEVTIELKLISRPDEAPYTAGSCKESTCAVVFGFMGAKPGT